MYAVSAAFLREIVRAHKPRTRVRVLDRHQFGTANPTSIATIDVIDGDVRMTAAGDIKATADLTVPGVWWGHVAPYGRELFIERGVEFANGSVTYVPFGYFRIDEVEQEGAPDGPVRISCSDRNAQLRQSRVVKPWQIPDGTSHTDVIERLINGDAGVTCYPTFPGKTVPWFADYDTDAAKVYGGVVVEDSIMETLTELADQQGCQLRWYEEGSLGFQSREPSNPGTPVWNMTSGEGGNLVSVSRKISRDGVYNVVVAYGTNPAAPTSYKLAKNNSPTSLLSIDGKFGPSLRFFGSPLLRTDTAAAAAAQTVLDRYSALPESQSLDVLPNPALRPLDVLAVFLGRQVRIVAIDQVTCPLAGDAPMRIEAREVGAPPADSGQRPSAGSGTVPYQTGTVVEVDPDTGENVIDIGGGEFTNLPVSGCCDFGVGDYVNVGWGDSGPIVMGPIGAYPSIDPFYGGIGGTLVTDPTYRNLCPNPGLVNDANGWVISVGGRTTGLPFFNSTGLRLTDLGTVMFPEFEVEPGNYYFMRWSERTLAGAVNVKWTGVWEWLDAGGGVVYACPDTTGFASTSVGNFSAHVYGFDMSGPGGTVAAMLAPPGAAKARYRRTYEQNAPGATAMDLAYTDVRADVFELPIPVTVPFFFDGSSTHLGSIVCTWDGAPGSSTSSAT